MSDDTPGRGELPRAIRGHRLEDRILALDDADAIGILSAYSRSQPTRTSATLLDRALVEQLKASFDVATDEAGGVSEGELARSALLMLAEDPDQRDHIARSVDSGPMKKFALVETAAVVSAVLLVLQTHIRLERRRDGKWSMMFEKKPTDTRLLRDLIRKLLSFA